MPTDLVEEVNGAHDGPEGGGGDVAVRRLQRPRGVVPEAGRVGHVRTAVLHAGRDGLLHHCPDVRVEAVTGLYAKQVEKLAQGFALGTGGDERERQVDRQWREDEVACGDAMCGGELLREAVRKRRQTGACVLPCRRPCRFHREERRNKVRNKET